MLNYVFEYNMEYLQYGILTDIALKPSYYC